MNDDRELYEPSQGPSCSDTSGPTDIDDIDSQPIPTLAALLQAVEGTTAELAGWLHTLRRWHEAPASASVRKTIANYWTEGLRLVMFAIKASIKAQAAIETAMTSIDEAIKAHSTMLIGQEKGFPSQGLEDLIANLSQTLAGLNNAFAREKKQYKALLMSWDSCAERLANQYALSLENIYQDPECNWTAALAALARELEAER